MKNQVDWLASAALLAATALYGLYAVNFARPPFEDAAMLMRYSEHLAQGAGIVWNIGEQPVDGATDFLFMTSVAGLIRAGLPTGRAVRFLGVAAHAFTVLLVYWVNRKRWHASPGAAFFPALYMAVGPGLWFVAAYFGTTFFAFFAAATWALGLTLMESDTASPRITWAFAVGSLITGLVRPDGVVLVLLMLVGIATVRGWRRSRNIILAFLATMILLGGAYFLWRWSYFGHPLPNPFYKKGAGLLHWDAFWESLGYLVRFAGPFGLAYVLGFRTRALAHKTMGHALPLVGFAAIFVLISNETNFGGRFQYALWPLVMLSYFPLVRDLGPAISRLASDVRARSSRSGNFAAMAVLALAGFAMLRYAAVGACAPTSGSHGCGLDYEADGRYDVATRLADFRDRGYIMATSEAGLLPLYSGWRAIDTWGLNDPWIAQNGEITEAYLDGNRPHLIIFHAYFSPLVPAHTGEKDLAHDWHRMTLILKDYAESRGYVLAAAFGDSPYESHYYYVRPDFEDSDRIARFIATTRTYTWSATGKRAINYAEVRQ